MADRVALFCSWMAEPEDCFPLWNDREKSDATSQAMDLTGDITGLPRPHSLRNRLRRSFLTEYRTAGGPARRRSLLVSLSTHHFATVMKHTNRHVNRHEGDLQKKMKTNLLALVLLASGIIFAGITLGTLRGTASATGRRATSQSGRRIRLGWRLLVYAAAERYNRI